MHHLIDMFGGPAEVNIILPILDKVQAAVLYLVPSFLLTLTIALNVAAIVPMISGKFLQTVSLVLSTCISAQHTHEHHAW